MANETVNRQINIYIQSGEAQKVYDKLIQKEKELNKQLSETTDPKRQQKLREELAKLAEPIDRATKKLKGELSPTFKDLQSTVARLSAQLRHMSADDADYSKVLKQYNQANLALDEQKQKLSGIATAQKGFSGFLNSFLGNLAATGVAAAGALISNFFSGTIDEADQAQEAVDGLRNSLENVGRGDLLQPLLKQADEFAEKYKRLDNDDITGVFTKLVDYGKLTKDQMKDVTEVIINYAAKQKISLGEATDVVTKALEGSAKGLKMYGINLTEAKTVTERYNIIVDQLGSKVAGAEAAFEKTNRGLKETIVQGFRNAQEAVGNFLYSLTGVEKQSFKNAVAAKQEAQEGQVLIARYEELSKKVNKTAEDKAELQNITSRLTSIFGTSVVSINKETGALQLNVQATKDLIKQKLLLANSKAAEVAAKFNKQTEDENSAIEEQKKLIPQIIALQQKLGTTAAEVRSKTINRNAKSEGFGTSDQSGLTDDEQTLLNLSDQLNSFIVKKRAASSEIKALAKDLEELGFSAKDVTKLFNPQAADPNAVVGGGDPNANPEADKKADAKKKKEQEDRQKALDDIAKYNRELLTINQSELDQEIQKAFEKWEALKTLAHGNRDILKQIEEGFYKEVDQIRLKYARKELEAFEKARAAYEKSTQTYFENAPKLAAASLSRLENLLNSGEEKSKAQKRAELEYEIAKASGQKKFKLQMDLLDMEEKAAVDAAIKNGEDTEIIHKQYDLMRETAVQDHLARQVEMYLGFASQIAGIFSTIDQMKAANENAELERDRKLNEKKKQNLERQVKKGVLTRLEADRKMEELDKAQEKKEQATRLKQFRRDQRMQITQALMNGAQGVVSTLAARPGSLDILSLGTFRAINVGLVLAATAAQVAAIASQKPPQFAKGGVLRGPSHAENNGMPVTNPRTGQVQAYMEGDEAIINKRTMRDRSRYTVTGTPSQIASKLNAMHGGVHWEGGATLQPVWRTVKPARMNFSAIQSAQRMYAAGGQFGKSAVAEGASEGQMEMMDTINNLAAVLNAIQQNGITAIANIQQFNQQNERLSNIKADATLK